MTFWPSTENLKKKAKYLIKALRIAANGAIVDCIVAFQFLAGFGDNEKEIG